MKKTSLCFFGAALIAAGLSAPAAAIQIIPSQYAPLFCAARRSGMSVGDASRFATRMSIDSTKPPLPKIDGISLDVKLAVYEAMALCPDAFRGDTSTISY